MTGATSMEAMAAAAVICTVACVALTALLLRRGSREAAGCTELLERIRKEVSALEDEAARMQERLDALARGMGLSEAERRKVTQVIRLYDLLDRDGFWQGGVSPGTGRRRR